MTDTRLGNFNQLDKFLGATKEIEFKAQSRAERYGWIESTLKRFKYLKLSRKKKGLVRRHMTKITDCSASRVIRLIAKYQKEGELKLTEYQRHSFNRIYTDQDIKLLVVVDNLNLRPSGHAVTKILKREYNVFYQLG